MLDHHHYHHLPCLLASNVLAFFHMLCESCYAIFDKLCQPGIYRQVGLRTSCQNLQTSALAGCQICSGLWEFLRGQKVIDDLSADSEQSVPFTTYDLDSSGGFGTGSFCISFKFPTQDFGAGRYPILFNLEPLTGMVYLNFSVYEYMTSIT